jgi:predicted RNA-binding Zn-ribbon protein involved in translation (DUF1610 family)
MKRRTIIKLLLFLLAGAIINVAVAWACATMSGCTTDLPEQWVSPLFWPTHVSDDWPAHPLHWTSSKGLGVKREGFTVSQRPALDLVIAGTIDIQRSWMQSRHSAGWPCLTLEHIDALPPDGPWASTGIKAPEWFGKGGWFRLPSQPRYAGFAINTIFYAALLWMLFAAPFALRRRIRIKRGQCASCGYSLRESVSDKCPECGAVVLVPAGAREYSHV